MRNNKAKEQEFLQQLQLHKGIVYKISKMYEEDPENRADLVQEIIFQLWKSYDGFQQKSKFSTWMYRVSLNTALTFFKKKKKENSKITFSNEEFHIKEENYNSEKDEQIELFYKAVQELNKIEKALIFLYLEGQTYTDISKNLGISEVNARVKLSRIKEKLQKIIKDYTNGNK